MMTGDKKTAYVTRDALLKLLSNDEVASVSSAETAAQLAEGDEYLDLQNLGKGVRKAQGKTTPAGRMLPRKAVHAKTWDKIVAQLQAPPAAAPPARSRR